MHDLKFFFFQVPSNAATLYDALIFYAMTVNQMRNKTLDIRDGKAFFEEAQSISFNGKCCLKLVYCNMFPH